MSKKEERFSKFSVALGLLDYINPICYCITMVTIVKHTRADMGQPYGVIFLIGAIISIFFGFIIPTGKIIVGLGLIKFRMPVSLVFCVNTGIFISGLMLLRYALNMSIAWLCFLIAVVVVLLILIYRKSKKINTIAVLTGAAGYVMLYTSLITMAARQGSIPSIIMYAIAILLFVMLCGIGIKANLKDPKVHWVIEASNVVCQMLVAAATLLLIH
ncbi:MAG: hypothetical protein IJG40_05115 [Oscillospiraceae bacterium]|nr:hypothetical protein [Oscillospiraceae bacterium]